MSAPDQAGGKDHKDENDEQGRRDESKDERYDVEGAGLKPPCRSEATGHETFEVRQQVGSPSAEVASKEHGIHRRGETRKGFVPA